MDALLNMLQSMSLHACWPLTLFGKENIQNVHILDSNFLENKIQMFLFVIILILCITWKS